mgnify:CR=1 FL=1
MRTSFYSTLCKLLFADEHNLKFKAFMEPFTALLTELSENVSLDMFRTRAPLPYASTSPAMRAPPHHLFFIWQVSLDMFRAGCVHR